MFQATSVTEWHCLTSGGAHFHRPWRFFALFEHKNVKELGRSKETIVSLGKYKGLVIIKYTRIAIYNQPTLIYISVFI